MSEPARHTDPETIRPRRALYPAGAAIRFEVFATRRRYAFGRHDYYVEPARGRGGKWTKESALEFLEDKAERGDDRE